MASTPLFDRIADLYERYAEINDGVYRPYLRRSVPDDGGRAVDLGCGSGRYTGLLADRCQKVLAVDVARRELEIARLKRGRENIEYREASVLDVRPEQEGGFDVVVSVNTMFHLFSHHGRSEVLQHVRSLVAPGGTAIIIDVVSPYSRSALVHRWWGVGEAARTIVRRRSLADAWTVLKVRQHRVWMEHTRVNHPLSRAEFHRAYAEEFPGAEFTDDLDPFICAMRWTRPLHNASGR